MKILADRIGALPNREPVSVVWEKEMDPPPGLFFRRVPGTSFLAYDQASAVWLEDFQTGERLRAPGYVDFVPSPRGRFFVTPSQGSGLAFYEGRGVFEAGREDTTAVPAYIDLEMDDQYPSIGLLSATSATYHDYRVLISWYEGAAVRDYRVYFSPDDGMTVRPLGPKRPACLGRTISLPIISPDGLFMTARDEGDGTTSVWALNEDGTCSVDASLGRSTSKATFSPDGRRVVYSAPVPGTRTESAVFVFDRATGRHGQLPGATTHQLTIPEFVGPDSILLVATPPDWSNPRFRMFCCISSSAPAH